MLWRRRFANRVQPEPRGVDGAVMGSRLETDLRSAGREKESLKCSLSLGFCGWKRILQKQIGSASSAALAPKWRLCFRTMGLMFGYSERCYDCLLFIQFGFQF
ncbi:hypothetical protein GH733_011621 [Mirounga leonina]|nr:hypothetical protein GH733_011621 [Mirounga leonina]